MCISRKYRYLFREFWKDCYKQRTTMNQTHIDHRPTQASIPLRKRIPPLLIYLLFFNAYKSVNSFSAPLPYNLYNYRYMVQQHQPSLYHSNGQSSTTMSASASSQMTEEHHYSVCELPGDPSLILTTNVDLGDTKMQVMKGKKRFAFVHSKIFEMWLLCLSTIRSKNILPHATYHFAFLKHCPRQFRSTPVNQSRMSVSIDAVVIFDAEKSISHDFDVNCCLLEL